MKGILTTNQLEYVLFHLDHSFELSPEIRDLFVFGDKKDGRICFYLDPKEYNEESVLWLDDLPLLFPGDRDQHIYDFQDGTLQFNHDILKSAFYLLSGYQEYQSIKKDNLGRFPYEGSIQDRLEIIMRPVVNEYFNIIIKALLEYCKYHNISCSLRSVFREQSFFLTHDVDRIDKYTFHTIKGKFKKGSLKEAFAWLLKWINPFYRKNPKWTFDYLESTEKRRNINSTYFFLNKGVKHIDSYYSFGDKRIKTLIERLEKSGCGIGLHGGVKSAFSFDDMKSDLSLLNSVTQNKVKGNRQHRLLFQYPETMIHLEKNGILYDSSLGFAQHEGFRNNYCLPFKLFDFEHDRMINVWEIPLNVMDGTLFTYRELGHEKAFESIVKLKNEISKYNGVFTLLFHPDFLDEEEHPGIRSFYEKTLDLFCKDNVSSFQPQTLVEK